MDRFSVYPFILLGCLGWAGCASEVARAPAPPAAPDVVSIGTPVIDYTQVGLTCFRSGDYAGAISAYTRALGFEPTNGKIYTLRGIAETKTKDLTDAASDFSKAIQFLPNDALSYENRGFLRARQGDLVGAISDYDQAIQIDPGNFLLYEDRGRIDLKIGNVDAAIGDYDKATDLNPRSASSFYGLSLARNEKGDHTGALHDADEDIRLEPNSVLALCNRGRIEELMGNHASALLDTNQAAVLDPQNPTIYAIRTMSKDCLGDFPGALSDVERLLVLQPAELPYDERGRLKMKMGDFAGGLADMTRRLRSLEGQNSTHKVYLELYCHVARLRLGIGDKEWDADKVSAGTESAWTKRLVQFLNGDLPEAVLLADAGDGNPETDREQKCEAYYFIGVSHLLSGDKMTAKNDFEKSVATKEVTWNEYAFARVELDLLRAPGVVHSG